MIRTILKHPDKRLRTVSKEVDNPKYDPYLNQPRASLCMDLRNTLLHNGGLGLAAPQIGVFERIILYRDYAKEFKILVNPEIVSSKGETVSRDEGCLSVPGFRANVKRAKVIKVEAYDEHGNEVRIKANGTEAIVLQHEIDHLDGVLFIDKVGDSPRKRGYIEAHSTQ